jgi:hypothetical protein
MEETMSKYPMSGERRGVEYAEEDFSFTVDVDDVKGSVVGDTQNCAAACALRMYPHVNKAWVMRTRTIIEFKDSHPQWGGRTLRWMNPRNLQTAVEHFDGTAGLFPPGIYDLRVVTPARRVKKRDRKVTGTRPYTQKNKPSWAIR